jgi:hypothetical protein
MRAPPPPTVAAAGAEKARVRGVDVRSARRKAALISIAEGLQRVSEGLLSLADAENADDDAAGANAEPKRRRAWRAPTKPRAPTDAELATVTPVAIKKAELALRKRGLV